ncbi:MAG: Na+/H+ antiporter subunit E [Candidatus Latescibacteria bacterium]|nr:Na+/H+ antiporter subunit E [Candidatus Latescibacterota bacterium]
MKRIVLFILVFVVWIVLVWPFDPDTGLRGQDVIVGLGVALLVTLVMREVPLETGKGIHPTRTFWMFVYLFVLAYYVVKANLDVVYRVLHPAMPIRPGIVKVRTKLRNATAITALANSITLTPGTLCVNATEDGVLYVHWINVKTTDEEEAAKYILQRFEWFLEKIFVSVQ